MQIASGVLLPIVLIFVLKIATERRVMGNAVNGPVATTLRWGVAIGAGTLSVAYLLTSLLKKG